MCTPLRDAIDPNAHRHPSPQPDHRLLTSEPHLSLPQHHQSPRQLPVKKRPSHTLFCLAVTTVSISTGLAVVVFLLGLGLSLGASEVLVTGLGRLGGKLGLAAGLLGLLVALGADAPEISSAITALLSGAKDVGLGVILGSNLFNLAALLGLSAVIAGRLHFRRILVTLDGGVALVATGVIALLLLAGLPPLAAMGLLGTVLGPYVF